MLQNSLELIVQYPEPQGYRCRGFRGLHLGAPVYVVFEGADTRSQSDANRLGMAFCAELLRYIGSQENAPPCDGHRPNFGCHALGEPSCKRILVRTAAGTTDGAWPLPTAEVLWLDGWPKPNWEVVPIMPAGSVPGNHLPTVWQGINTGFWTRDPAEELWRVFQHAGLAPEESRIFISYVRRDTTPIADQLFEALTNIGFDVFLDRSSVPVGVEFQERLMQDLVDKAMVVLLNSENVSQSKWVGEEIATIKKFRLGFLELVIPPAPARLDTDVDARMKIDANGDLKPAGPHYAAGAKMLTDSALTRVTDNIKETHGRALHRRRYELIDNFAFALRNANKTAQVLPDGTFVFPPQGNHGGHVVGLTTRIPELGDFCSLHQRGSVSANRAGWIISPSPFFVAQRQAQVTWLGGVCNIQHVNEGQLTQLVNAL